MKTLFASFVLSVCGLLSTAYAQINDSLVERAGLVVHWQANIGGTALARGADSMVIWPHGTQKKELVTVTLGGRVLEQFRGSDINDEELENAILAGKRTSNPPRLGLEGAKKKAEKLSKTYMTLGRKVEIKPEDPQLIYIVALSASGFLTAMDGESGAVAWRNQISGSDLPMFGPGVSDDYVVVVAGNHLSAFELESGRTVTSRKLDFIPTGTPTVADGKAIVPSVGGRLVAYDILDHKIAPTTLRIGQENRLGTTLSPDRAFLSWPVDSRLIIAKLDSPPKLWTSVKASATVPSLSVPVQGGFLLVSSNGDVIRTSTDRIRPIVWISKLGITSNKSPVAGKNIATVLSEDGLLYGLKLADGSSAWERPIQNVQGVLTVTEKNVYLLDASRALVVYDANTGAMKQRVQSLFPKLIANSKTDRLFFVTEDGEITCLRESDAVSPSFTNTMAPLAKPAPEKEPTLEESAPTEQSTEDLFGGDADAPMGDTPAGDDPFGDPSF